MKAVVVFILGALILTANASILEHIYNNTHLRGNVLVDTKDGIKLGYDGSLGYKNGFLGFEIARVGAKFNALARPGAKLGNTTNGTVDYSGEIQLSGGGGHQANVSVDGTAGLYAEYDKQDSDNGTSIGYNASLTNHNNWSVSAGDKEAAGTSGSILNVTGRNCIGNGSAYVHQKFRGVHGARGNFTDGNDTHNFMVTKFGGGGVKKKIYFHHGPHGVAGPFPSVGYKGIAGVKTGEYIMFDRDRIQNLEESGAKFGGMVWVDKDEDDNSWVHKIKHAKSADYGKKGATIVNGEVAVLSKAVGTVGELHAAEVNVTKDYKNLTGAVFKSGNVHEFGVVNPHPEKVHKEQIEKEIKALKGGQDYELNRKDIEELLDQVGAVTGVDHHGGIKTYLHAKWAAGKGVEAHRNDDNTVDVDSHGGVVWEAVGADSRHKKPWHKHGGLGFNSSFEIDPNQGALRNVEVKVDQDSKIVEEMKQKFQGIDIIARRW